MSFHVKSNALILAISSCLVLSACQKQQETKETTTENKSEIEKQIEQQPTKKFANTPNDGKDIATLIDFQERFSEMSDEMENELMTMQKEGNLTPEFEIERRKDVINSAFSMLKALDLKTEQGRYIQGLLYQYWEGQQTVLKQRQAQPNASYVNSSLDQYLQAQKQLQQWKTSQPRS
ncbi:hypothetical protein [Acinetobacter gerneri]|uniref:hypothetical protein n=1 Tax=Acinetobacter gerneri TaxID=202952 RepID=UPI0028AA7613|nr:hypothetical protein [Acinetobacter gerneri]